MEYVARLEDRFLHVFRSAALQAGAVARHLRGRVRSERKVAAGGSPEAEALTAVDLAAQDVILLRVLDELPEVAVDAEEDTELVGRFPAPEHGRPVVILDPIDGTLNYTLGSDDYAVMGALLLDGRYRAAVIHLPEAKATWCAIAGEGCYEERLGHLRRRVRRPPAPPRALVTPKVSRPAVERLRALGLEVRRSRCSAIDAAIVALGRGSVGVAEAADRRRAIGLLLTMEAGGAVLFGDRPWKGEDPERSDCRGASVVSARTAALARRVVATLCDV